MRKIVAELFSSLDGVVGSPDQWHGPFHDEEMEQRIAANLAAADTMLLGRRTYEEHAGYWPTATGGLADRMNDLHKVGFSATLPALEWRNSTLVGGDRLTWTLLASHSYRSGTVSATYAVAR
ncbi:dihydrofolate reductase family protein [Nonomuraea angiospora]|uniref:Dihydrofolate reductase n=1 Tax=Nonomuraea angiospora TaxID=46172 RepID=A0ABR9MG67_9ACTN|nr:dihydrofolate reductase family protein [Nonomuraea angiospora]MBE1591904.1 dihydrofolate reductase [Nonomuraea angiospora]